MPGNIDNDALYTQSGRQKVSLKFPLFESKHISSANELQWETRVWGAIINHGTPIGTFQVNEIFEEETGGGVKTGKRGYIKSKTASSITYDTTHSSMPLGGSNNKFTNGNTIRGLTSGATAVITNCNTGSDHRHDYYTSSIRLQVGLNNGDKVIRQMALYPPYFSGFEPTIEQTFELDLKDGVRQRIFTGDDLNGIGLKIEGRLAYFYIRTNGPGKEGTPGTVKEEPLVPRFAEAGNTLKWKDGRGINFERAQIQKVVYKWLGYGAGQLYFVQDNKEVLCAEISHVDQEDDVYMRTPSLPARFEIENFTAQTSATEMRVVCVNYSSEGGVLFPGLEFGIPPLPYFGAVSNNNPELSLANTDGTNGWCLLGLVSLRNNWPLQNTQEGIPAGLPNRKTWRWLDDAISVSGKNVIYQLVHIHELRTITTKTGPTNYTYDAIPWVGVDGGSAVQYFYGIITAWTASHLHGIGSPRRVLALVGGAGTGIEGSSEFVNAHSTISQNYESKCSQCFGIIAKTLETGTAVVTWGISGIEVE